MNIFYRDGSTGDGLGLCLIGKLPPDVMEYRAGIMHCRTL